MEVLIFIYLFMVYLTTLLVSEAMQRQIIELLMNK
jgi:hypothetical protein